MNVVFLRKGKSQVSLIQAFITNGRTGLKIKKQAIANFPVDTILQVENWICCSSEG